MKLYPLSVYEDSSILNLSYLAVHIFALNSTLLISNSIFIFIFLLFLLKANYNGI